MTTNERNKNRAVVQKKELPVRKENAVMNIRAIALTRSDIKNLLKTINAVMREDEVYEAEIVIYPAGGRRT